ncbi:MAG: hypothetical protein QNJ88_12715 [Acidimicrobiia bacterium]|nr:hypothetical protein [Acidimicrobiia bacterium]
MRSRILMAVALLLLVAACGGDGNGDDDGVLSLQDDDDVAVSTTSRIAADEAVLEMTQCMRDKGLDVPDIGITADGQLDLRPEDFGNIDVDSEVFEEAFTSCIAIFQLSGGFDVALDPELEALFTDQLQDFSQCMRDNGVPDFPDPQTGTGTPYPLTAFSDFNNSTFQDALETCRETVSFTGFTD